MSAHNGPPPLDPQLRAALEARLATRGELSLESIPAARLPDPDEIVPTDEGLSAGGRFAISRHIVPADGRTVGVVVARPTRHTGALPILFHTHGGGMFAGDALSGLDEFLDYADALGSLVVSVDYRLAPECPHPGPLDDCFVALSWTHSNAGALGGDPERIIVAGASAGGGLAAGLALLARDNGGPPLIGQLLQCPMIDDRNDSRSGHQVAAVEMWNRQWNGVAWSALLGPAAGGPEVSPYAAPARMADLGGLPPAYIDVGSVETFRDEDVAYATGIWAAGGAADLHVWGGGVHGFDRLRPDALLAGEARRTRLAWLARVLHHQAAAPEWWSPAATRPARG